MNSFNTTINHLRLTKPSRGFTIVELLIVIVVIGILAAITVVSYNGIQNRAAAVTLKSDLRQGSNQIEIDRSFNGAYPLSESAVNDNRGLQKSPGTNFQYTADSGSYCLTAWSDRQGVPSFYISSTSGTIREGTCPGYSGGGSAPSTQASCFATQDVAGGVEITDYYGGTKNEAYIDYVSVSLRPECPHDVVIPSEIDGKPVVSLGDESFMARNLTSVVIPDTVASLGVFSFTANSLTSINIPGSVKNIGGGAFSGLYDDGNTSDGLNKLTLVTIEDGVQTIGSSAFTGSISDKVVIPRSVTSIESYAFRNVKVGEVPTSTTVASGNFQTINRY